jgi:Secretion system C-terminal sorting domain/Bacterial Ig-like domain (group 2)
VSGLTAGTSLISYSVTNGCGSTTVTGTLTVSTSPVVAAISGSSFVCQGASIVLSDAIPGGTWSSSNTTASVVGGTVTGMTMGIDTIAYTITNACGTAIATKTVSVGVAPNAGAISGASNVCVGSSITLTDAVGGGIWSASNNKASVSGGTVIGVASGTDTIKYTVTNACGSAMATKVISIISAPRAGSITGPSSVCVGETIALSDLATGGMWTSSSPTVAGVLSTGAVTGLSAGAATIDYTVTNSCGTVSAVHPVTVLSPADCNGGFSTLVNNVGSTGTELRIYPNPNNGTFVMNLLSGTNEPVHVTIMNLIGQKVKEFTTTTNREMSIELTVPSGFYFLSATTDNGNYTSKVTVR